MNGNQLPQVRYDLIHLAGGLDQVTPTLSLKPGVMRRAANFECSITGGYTRIAGYERFDGRPAPSAALYNVLVVSIASPISVGSTVVGQTSGATAKVLEVNGQTVVLTRQTGYFVVEEVLKVGTTVVGAVISISGAVADGLSDATYKYMAAEDYRADIGIVPGAGPIRGVAFYNDTVYAWRNNVGNTAMKMFKSSSSGWIEVSLGYEIGFTTGLVEILDGQTVVGGTSGATAVVKRTVTEDGTWGTDASGRLIVLTSTGTFQAGELLKVSGVTVATCVGPKTAITLLPNGRVTTQVGNVFGGPTGTRLYGCDSVNRGFEFDGTVYVPLKTGMATDKPEQIAVHKQHLFFSFGTSLQFCAIGNPYSWSPVFGAGEIAMNDSITCLIPLPGDQTSGALGVYTENDTSILYGTSSSDFKLSNFNSGTGAMPYTAQNMDQTYAFSQRGVMGMSTTLAYGNFLANSMTMNIRPYIQARRQLATASCLNREKGQYRLFFSDGACLYMTVANGKLIGCAPVELPNPVLCCVSGGNGDGAEVSYFGSSNGYVYTLDVGTSFDGAVIPANITLVFNSTGSPRVLKRYRRASLEVTGDSFAQFAFSYDLGYRTPELEQPGEQSYSTDLRESFWDALTWDNFVFDGRSLSPTEVEVTGTAENMAIRISSVSNLFKPFTVNSAIVHYSMRRGIR